MQYENDLKGWLKIETVRTCDSDGNLVHRTRRFSVVRPPAEVLKLIMPEDAFVEVELINESEESADPP